MISQDSTETLTEPTVASVVIKPFEFNEKQNEAIALIAGPATHIMMEGGSRSGKTFLMCWAITLRALLAPGSLHCILRFRFNHVIQSVWYGTFPKMMALCFPGIAYKENKAHWFIELPGGSQIWFGGLDDKERTEKILGNEYVTMGFNECSQIPYASKETARTRLAQRVSRSSDGAPMRLKALYDQNPPTKGHWSYKTWHRGVDPDTGVLLPNPGNYVRILLNPYDNKENISPEYIAELEGASARIRRRFLFGEYTDDNPSALFNDTNIELWRVVDGRLPDLIRIVVAVDPSGAGDVDNAENDEIGIVVAGLGMDGNAYVIEDLTCKAGPAYWGRVATSAYDRHQANLIVYEKNFGGAMVEHVILTSRPGTPCMEVNASRGKHVRAEPISALYEQGKVRHVGFHRQLEDELCAFSTTGYTGQGSPNRADALVWAVSALFPGLIAKPEQKPSELQASPYTSQLGFA